MPIRPTKHSFPTVLLFLLLTSEIATPISVFAGKPHVINFRSPNLYPEGLAWDPSGQHFLVGSIRQRTISTVSDAGIVETLVSDTSLPENVTVWGLAVDSLNNRILAVLHAMNPLPVFNALAAYDLRTGHRVFLSLLPSAAEEDGAATRPVANDVAVDYKGNAYVTNAADNYIWKVNDKGEAWIFSKSPMFKAHPVPNTWYSFCGLNGIAYVSKGYLLVGQTNTGKMFKVDEDDGTARLVLLNEDLMASDAVALRGDGVVLVVSPVQGKLWFLKSQDNWAQGVVFDKVDLDSEGFPTYVVAGEKDRAYVLYGRVDEGMKGNAERESFRIEEVRSPKESEDENIWLYVMVGVGLAYFLFWRFQMRQLVKNMDKKIN